MSLDHSFIEKTKPVHDNPLGKLHPYWARKPLNVIREIIRKLSREGDIVFDPFMGGGTTVFAALIEKRRAMGSDINPLSSFIVNSSLHLVKENECLETLDRFRKEYEDLILPWFKYDSNFFIERQRFNVKGDFEYGKFNLTPTDTILKQYKNGKFFGQRKLKNKINGWRTRAPSKYHSFPLNFKECYLQPNSRIAIPKGSTLEHFFTVKNQASINAALQIMKSYDEESQKILMFLLSACLPLLRLSDYKASSQWPYWRPKKNLTSRNPLVAVSKRLKDFQKAQIWGKQMFPNFDIFSIEDCITKKEVISASVFTSPIQNLSDINSIKNIDLIVTDPPYADQAPYLEYSSLWIQTLGLTLKEESYNLEMVKTDANDRKHHNEKYIDTLQSSIKICAGILKMGGYMVWFYQDNNLTHWSQIFNLSFDNNLDIDDVIPLPKQRRSMKTVTSPGKTFDGDLIIIFRKKKSLKKPIWTVLDAEKQCKKIIRLHKSFFAQYSALVKDGMISGWMPAINKKYETVNHLIDELM